MNLITDSDEETSIVTVWESSKIEELITWEFDYDVHHTSCFSSEGGLLATMFGEQGGFTPVIVLSTASNDFQATFRGRHKLGFQDPGLAFINGDTQLLYCSDVEFRIWDIQTSTSLFTSDRTNSKTDITHIQSSHCLSEQDHTILLRPYFLKNVFEIVRLSVSLTAERIDIIANGSAVARIVDGRPTFLEVREDTLWEFDRSTEQPLCRLPILWRRAYENDHMIWSGPILVFCFQGGDLGVLNIDRLRRDCTSSRRARAA